MRSLARGGRVLWSALRLFLASRGFFLASALAFNILLSVIPLCLLLLSVLGAYLHRGAEVADYLAKSLRGLVPDLDPRILEHLLGIVRNRRAAGIAGLLGVAWTSTMVFSSLRVSLNVIFKVARSRGPLHGLGVDLLLILVSGSTLLASMFLTSWVTVLQRYGRGLHLDLGPLPGLLLKYVLPLFCTFWMCFLVYKIAPNRRTPSVPALKAALFASLFWEAAKQLFGWFVPQVRTYSLIYGSLSAVAAFVLWVFYSAVIFLLGAAVASVLEGGRTGPPRGRRGADLRAVLPE